jgi:hypothetical protein
MKTELTVLDDEVQTAFDIEFETLSEEIEVF